MEGVTFLAVVLPKSLKEIVSYAFYKLDNFEGVFYKGTAEEWGKIKIGKNGNEFVDDGNDWGKVFYYSEIAKKLKYILLYPPWYLG